jgi:thiol:disulfide interchange protein DsbA
MLTKLLPGVLLALLFNTAAMAGDYPYAKDVHYQELFQQQPVETGDKIEIRELFWYGCPHCFDLEPILHKWLKSKPANAGFVRTPAVFRESWAVHAKAYYAFETLGVTEQVHGKLFAAIHEKKRKLNSAEQLADFAAENGIDRKQFLDTYNSFAVDSKLRQAQLAGQRYESNGVPTIIIDGKYRTTSTMAGGHKGLMNVMEFLINKAAQERKSAKP